MNYLFLLILIVFSSGNQKNKTSNTPLINITEADKANAPESRQQNLYELIGQNINSDVAQDYVASIGPYVVKNYFEGKKDYLYENEGIQIRTNLEGIIEVIYLYRYKTESWKSKSFKGNLPFGLTFSDTFNEITDKIGEGSLAYSEGWYGRLFRWQIQDSLKLSIELDLPKEENDDIFIKQLTLSKTK